MEHPPGLLSPNDALVIRTMDMRDLECRDSVLRRASHDFPLSDRNELEQICGALLFSLQRIPFGSGLSAIQLGIPVRVAVINLSRIPGREMFLINPQTVSLSGRLMTRSEGCLSLPGFKAPVTRRNKVTVRAFNRWAEEFVYAAVGFEAAVIQHELDHMLGRFYWDHLPPGIRPQPVQETEGASDARSSKQR